MTASGERRHRITVHAPEGTRGDGTAADLATGIAAKIVSVPLPFQQQERLAAGGLAHQTLYAINLRYRADVDADLVLIEECHTQRAFQILTIIPDDTLSELDLTCVVGNRPLVEAPLEVEPPPDSPLLDDLVSYWSFDADWNDLHGTNHLTNHNGVTSVPGKLGNAGDFEVSSSQYLSHPDPSPLGDEDFTYALWFKLESLGGVQVLVAKDDTVSRSYIVYYFNPKLNVIFGSNALAVPSTVEISDTNWHWFVWWHDATANTVNLQFDGGSVQSVATSGVFPPLTTQPVTIGAANNLYYFDGLIDDVALWRRVLTADERTQLYNSGNGLAYPFE